MKFKLNALYKKVELATLQKQKEGEKEESYGNMADFENVAEVSIWLHLTEENSENKDLIWVTCI